MFSTRKKKSLSACSSTTRFLGVCIVARPVGSHTVPFAWKPPSGILMCIWEPPGVPELLRTGSVSLVAPFLDISPRAPLVLLYSGSG